MRRFFTLIILIAVSSCSSQYELPAAVTQDAVQAGSQIVYLPSAKKWNNGGMVEDRIVFTKHVSSGSGSYSEYISSSQTLYPGTTYEFLDNGRLIGFNQHDLKFYEVLRQRGQFAVEELSPQQVQELFPDLQIIKLSQAVNGSLIVEKFPGKKLTFMLLNDTSQSFYHYSFENYTEPAFPFKSVLQVSSAGELVFSHFGSRDKLNPPLTIKIINSLKTDLLLK